MTTTPLFNATLSYIYIYIWELAKLAPPPRPFLFDSIFSICHFIGKSGVFLNARRICFAKTTAFSNKTSCTVSGKNSKQKNVVLGRVLAYFSYTNQGQGDLYLYRNNRLKLVPKHEFSLKIFARTFYRVLKGPPLPQRGLQVVPGIHPW